ncbi:hypothetical protein P3S68_015285 [Capsicum galapagoense]
MTVAGRRFGMPDSVLNIDGDSAASTSYSSSRRNMSAEGYGESFTSSYAINFTINRAISEHLVITNREF